MLELKCEHQVGDKQKRISLSDRSFLQAICPSISFTGCQFGVHPSIMWGAPCPGSVPAAMSPGACASKLLWMLGILQDYSLSTHISFWKLSLAFFLPLINVRNILLSCSLYPSIPLISSLSYSVCVWGCSVLMSLSVNSLQRLVASEKAEMERSY